MHVHMHALTRHRQTANQPYIHACMHPHARMYVRTHTQGIDRQLTRYTCMHARPHARMHIRTHARTQTHIYIYIRKNERTNGRTDGRTDRHVDIHIYRSYFLLLSSYFRVVTLYREVLTDRQIDRQTDR